LKVDLNFACTSTSIYLMALHLASAPQARLGSRRVAKAQEEDDDEGRAMRVTEVEVSGRLALACGGCGEVILFVGRERDWYEPGSDGRPRRFPCGGCGALLTLADRVVEESGSARGAGG
jgi:hypothetical protein